MVKQRIPPIRFLPAIIWFLILCFLFFLPGEEVPTIGWMERLHLDKVVHFGLFVILIVLAFWPVVRSENTKAFKLKWLFALAILAIAYGIITEFIQHYFIPGRSFDIWDWVADSCGVMAAVYIVRRFLKAYF